MTRWLPVLALAVHPRGRAGTENQMFGQGDMRGVAAVGYAGCLFAVIGGVGTIIGLIWVLVWLHHHMRFV